MKRPVTVNIYGDPANVKYTAVKGPLRNWLRDQKIPALYSATLGGWYVRTERIGDLIARAEHSGFLVKMRGAL